MGQWQFFEQFLPAVHLQSLFWLSNRIPVDMRFCQNYDNPKSIILPTTRYSSPSISTVGYTENKAWT
jgi:hypothetical protein